MRDVAFNPAQPQPELPHQDPAVQKHLYQQKQFLLHQQQNAVLQDRLDAAQVANNVPLAGTAANAAKGASEGGDVAAADGETEVTGTSVFDDLAGVKPHKFKRKELKQRLQTTVQQRRSPQQRKVPPRINVNPDDDDDMPIRHAATSAVSRLREDGRDALERDLENELDPLQRYALLHNAMREVDEQNLPALEKEELKEQLNGMLDKLMKEHRSEIRQGMKSAEDIEAAVRAMAGGPKPASLRELRFLYGAKGKGVFDSPLSPLAMAKALQERFGGDSFTSGLNSLRSKMSGELRAEHKKSQSPRFWLCMSDASAFNMVQSTHAIAVELRRDLVAKAQVLPKVNPAAITVSLLSVVEAGKSKVNSMVAQICDAKDSDPVKKALVYAQVAHAIKMLPLALWALDKQSQRLDLIDELVKQVVGTYGSMPMPELSVERKERQLLAEIEQMRAQVGAVPGGKGAAPGAVKPQTPPPAAAPAA
jgi:hypothetical protein